MGGADNINSTEGLGHCDLPEAHVSVLCFTHIHTHTLVHALEKIYVCILCHTYIVSVQAAFHCTRMND